MSSAKVYVVITDHERENEVLRKPGVAMEVFRFTGYVVGNPAVKASGPTEEAVLCGIRGILVDKRVGRRKIVEIDVGDELVVEDVLGS